MEGQAISGDEVSVNLVREEDEEEFRSCCEDEDEVWKETEEQVKGETKDESKYDLDEFSVKMFFKGMSIAGYGDPGCGLSGIGVVMERSTNVPAIQVQKRLDFYVEELVADYLALMDGLVEAVQNKVRRVYAFTDSELLYDQVSHEEKLEVPILVALRQRILEHASNLEAFVLKLSPDVDLERPSKLAQVAIGVVSFPAKGVESLENCSICCDDKPSLMMITMKCSHKFCSHCMRTYVDGKVQSSQVPIRCPQLRCKYYISTAECKSFLPLTSYESLEKSFAEANILHSDRMYCPFPNCSVLLDPLECFSARASSSSQSDNSCIECPVCQRFICADCGVPWHTSMSCEEFQNLPLEERDAADITLHRLAQSNSWRRCQQCRRMIELSQGCYHMTCWCGHEFCYSCGAEYRDSQQTCQCAFWDEDNNNTQDLVTQSMQESEQWAWETFNSLPMIMDAYSDQEKSQLALIQRFLAGGFSLSDHPPYQSPPRCTDSYVDAMKDLHQLPWLERCGHEFCYSCGAEYRDSQQTCQCAFWDEDNNNTQDLVTQSMQESEQWAWETFNSLPMIMDAYSDQEKSQLALIQRFLAGGFSLSDHPPYQSPPRCTDSYVDAMKDLHQLPWLERFVSVISDNYYEEYIQ